jgi:hypothetical protein
MIVVTFSRECVGAQVLQIFNLLVGEFLVWRVNSKMMWSVTGQDGASWLKQ